MAHEGRQLQIVNAVFPVTSFLEETSISVWTDELSSLFLAVA